MYEFANYLHDINITCKWTLAGRMISKQLWCQSINCFFSMSNIPLPSRSTALCPSISTDFRSHQRSFFVQWLMLKHKLTTDQSAQCLWSMGPWMRHLYYTHLPKGSLGKKEQKDWKSQREEDASEMKEQSPLHSWAHSDYGCLHKTCKDHASRHSSMHGRGVHDPPTWLRSF